MHDIEPHYKWRDRYIASEDERSPFYRQEYDEFTFHNKIYNYLIHPQWDKFGSDTLYVKILFVDYDEHFAILELIGEWNDCIGNDIMWLKREIADSLSKEGINKYLIIAENVLNFHGEDDDYYEEWYDDVVGEGGWIALVNLQEHVMQAMQETKLDYYFNFGKRYNNLNWRMQKPENLLTITEFIIHGDLKYLDK